MDFDLPYPKNLNRETWDSLLVYRDRLKDAHERGDGSLAVGSIRDLVEALARTVFMATGREVDTKADFGKLVNEAHSALGRLPGPDLTDHPELRNMASALRSLVLPLAPLRNQFGTGHGKVGDHEMTPELEAVTVEGGMLWCRWVLRRLEVAIAGSIPLLLDALHRDTFGRGQLRRRLEAANLKSLDEDQLFTLGLAVARRAASGTFMVAADGVDACLQDLTPSNWPDDYRRGLFAGYFLDAEGRFDLQAQYVGKLFQIARTLDRPGEAMSFFRDVAVGYEWSERYAKGRADVIDEVNKLENLRLLPGDAAKRLRDMRRAEVL